MLAELFDAAENDYYATMPATPPLEKLYGVLAEAADLVEDQVQRRRQAAGT